MGRETRAYFSYLLRLWKADENDETVWRCSLQEVHTGKVRGFATLSDLDCYLQSRTRLAEDTDEEVMPND
jgi:hypothetical protein